MSSYFDFTVASWFLGNVRVKPHSKHSAPTGWDRVNWSVKNNKNDRTVYVNVKFDLMETKQVTAPSVGFNWHKK